MSKSWYSRSQDLTYTDGHTEKEYHLVFETTDATLAGQIEKIYQDIMDGKPLPPVKVGDRYGKAVVAENATGDAISRQAIIDRLNYVIEHGVPNKSGKHAVSAETVKEYIEALPPAEQRTGQWIPCEDRLPEVGVPVLTFDGKYMRVERYIDWIDADGKKLKGEWWIDGTEGNNYNCVGLRDGTATHWMPLPEPHCGERMKGDKEDEA